MGIMFLRHCEVCGHAIYGDACTWCASEPVKPFSVLGNTIVNKFGDLQSRIAELAECAERLRKQADVVEAESPIAAVDLRFAAQDCERAAENTRLAVLLLKNVKQ